MASPGSSKMSRWALDVSPLRENRSFRLLFVGRLVSLAGLGMLAVVFSWQIYQLTDSSVHVALVLTTLGIASFVGSLCGGVLADRGDRRRLIVLSRSAAVLGFVVLAVNASAPEPSLTVLYVVAAWDGLAGGFSATALAAAVPSVVATKDLPAVGTLMAISLDVGAVISPLVAGVLIGWGGFPLTYWVIVGVSALSLVFLFQLPPIIAQRDTHSNERHAVHGFIQDLREGFSFATRDKIVGGVLLLGFIQIVCASPYVLIPEFVSRDLGGSAFALSCVYAAPAAGALIATACSGWLGRVQRIGRLQFIVFTIACLCVAAFGLAPTVAFAVVAMALVGAMDVLAEVARFTVLSERTPDHLRGRVASMWTAQGTIGESLGGPALSLLAKPLGAAGAIVAGGVLGAILTLVVCFTHAPLRTLTRNVESDVHEEKVEAL